MTMRAAMSRQVLLNREHAKAAHRKGGVAGGSGSHTRGVKLKQAKSEIAEYLSRVPTQPRW